MKIRKMRTISKDDFVKITKPGKLYTTHMRAAKLLGADYNPEDYEAYLHRTRPRYNQENYKFKYGKSPMNKNDIYRVLNMQIIQSTTMALIESVTDHQQFIIGSEGIEAVEDYRIPYNILPDDLFTI